ncbi:hypothetical protein HQ544_01370 [Candidatus Falkowbacteria bacterium]|nr:hypothetical protein [Candidatus Falkowbacteria bacterium]
MSVLVLGVFAGLAVALPGPGGPLEIPAPDSLAASIPDSLRVACGSFSVSDSLQGWWPDKIAYSYTVRMTAWQSATEGDICVAFEFDEVWFGTSEVEFVEGVGTGYGYTPGIREYIHRRLANMAAELFERWIYSWGKFTENKGIVMMLREY